MFFPLGWDRTLLVDVKALHWIDRDKQQYTPLDTLLPSRSGLSQTRAARGRSQAARNGLFYQVPQGTDFGPTADSSTPLPPAKGGTRGPLAGRFFSALLHSCPVIRFPRSIGRHSVETDMRNKPASK